MKTHLNNWSRLLLLLATLGSEPAGQSQTFTTTFTALYNLQGGPEGPLIVSGDTLYGTISQGGDYGNGTVFRVNTDGTGYTNLYSFSSGTPPCSCSVFTNSDGGVPEGRLSLMDDTLYGIATFGGGAGNGTVFSIKTNGTYFQNLHTFSPFTHFVIAASNEDGANPRGGLILTGTTLYGTAKTGGAYGLGTVFALNIDGTDFRTLHNFDSLHGGWPSAELILSSNVLYGTTQIGGDSVSESSSGNGTIFMLNTDGTGFLTLHNFGPSPNNSYTNVGGAMPTAGLAIAVDTLYGTAVSGGATGSGTVFAMKTDGSGFAVLHDFSAALVSPYENGDGAAPNGTVILVDNTLYGTASGGGGYSHGTVFSITTNGDNFAPLYYFLGPDEPFAGLVMLGNSLLGTTVRNSGGTIFSLLLPAPPQLAITPSGQNVILTWPANATGFTLQSTTNLASPVWTTNSPAPVVINGQFTVTNPLSGSQQFFRLSQ